jgi:site-specific DNA recombinase
VPAEWVFQDEGYSGATLYRPALERLRDLVCQVPVEVVLCYAPDRLARKYAYQALLVEELARAGTEVVFLNGPTGDRPEDQLLVQFQGMIAEYEKAQIIERTRRGKAHRAKQGSVNVLSGAPYGYRYVRKSDHAQARYEVVEPQASVVRELFRRYVAEHVSIADLARWLSEQQLPTATGKARWDRSTVWGMLRNPAYAGRAAFAKTIRTDQPARLTRPARLQGRRTSPNPLILDRPRQDWVEIAVPALVSEETFQLAARRLADNQRFAARNTKVPSLLQGLAACEGCGYADYRTSTRTSTRKLYYDRCLGSDDYRYPGGRRCANLHAAIRPSAMSPTRSAGSPSARTRPSLAISVNNVSNPSGPGSAFSSANAPANSASSSESPSPSSPAWSAVGLSAATSSSSRWVASAPSRPTIVAQNRSSALRFAPPMILSMLPRPGGSICSARHLASRAWRCRSGSSSLGQTCSASQTVSLSRSPWVASRNPSAVRICRRWYSIVRPVNA